MKTFNMKEQTAAGLQAEQDLRNQIEGADNKSHPYWWSKNDVLAALLMEAESRPRTIRKRAPKPPQRIVASPVPQATVYGTRR